MSNFSINEFFSLYKIADVAVFHSRNFRDDNYTKFFSSPNFTNPNRLNVFFTLESSPYENILNKHYPMNFFNVSMTFRKDSNVWLPYDNFEKIDNETKNDEIWTEKEIETAMKKKEKLVLQFVSNCVTNSRREHYLRKLLEQINVTVYGRCNNNPCKNDSCFKNEIGEFDFHEIFENFLILEKHFFYLAFENSVCQNYITEKFWRIKSLIVPIVLKRSIVNDIVDDKYFLAVDDFDSPKKLVEKLNFLVKNPKEYKKYCFFLNPNFYEDYFSDFWNGQNITKRRQSEKMVFVRFAKWHITMNGIKLTTLANGGISNQIVIQTLLQSFSVFCSFCGLKKTFKHF